MSKKKRISMRKFYEEQTGRKLPEDFDIHHIDLNPENNDILNLLALPRQVHQDYHKSFIGLHYLQENFFIPSPKWPYPISTAEVDMILEQTYKVRSAYAELCEWYNFRNGLLGILDFFIPNKKYYY